MRFGVTHAVNQHADRVSEEVLLSGHRLGVVYLAYEAADRLMANSSMHSLPRTSCEKPTNENP